MKKLKLSYYDKKISTLENIGFLKRLFSSSKQGLLISILFIGSLLGLDYGARQITSYLCSSTDNTLNFCADFLYKVNDLIGVKFLDYFKDVIVIVAGVLGVILGLFFTTFLNIITSKYSNINSTIISQLLKQKVINRYFKLLAILVSSSIIFQFLLVIGYNPTFISAFLFSLIVIVTLLAFIFFGRYSLIYFNAGNLVFDLINSCNQILNRVYKNKKYFYTNQKGKNTLPSIIRNIEKIKIIVEESTKPQLSNTALDSISDELLSFAIRYNSFKHTFPSDKSWHPKALKHKRWDEASSSEFEMFSRIGSSLFPETIDDYLYIEKQIINTQFFIFRNIVNPNGKVQLIYNQFKYLQTISFQCEVELFETFFDQLELYVKDNLKVTDDKENEENLQLISLYANLLIQYLVGLNHNLERIITEKQLRRLAKAIHNFENTDSIMQFPYSIRIWADKYQQKLLNEKFNEKKTLTPIFYTEFELAYQFQNLLKTSFEKVVNDMHKRILAFSNYLRTSKLNLESLEFLSETLDVYHKANFFSGNIENKITNEINTLNLKKEEDFSFSDRDNLLERNEIFRKKIINEIWQVGWSSYTIKNKKLPDIYGNFYQLICADILDKAFENKANALIKFLPQFYTYNFLYIESLREKIDSKRFDFTASKLFPVIVDLFEISALAIIMFKVYNNDELKKSFFDFWDNAFKKDDKEEKRFWSMIIPIYEYFNQPLFGLSTPSYVREHKRRGRLENFLKESDLVRLEEVKGGFRSFMQHYVTDIEDIYFKDIVRRLSVDGFSGLRSDDLSDVFIEYYLRTRIALKELNIKETRYGSNLKRYMERDSE